MRKIVHNISVRVFEKDSNKIDRTKNVFKELIPVDFEKEKLDIEHEKAEGFNQKTIHILSIETSKNKHNRILLENIFNKLDEEDKKRIKQQKKNRLDSEGNFYLRLDKDSLLNKKFRLTEGGDCFHFTIKLAAYPMKKEKIMNSLNLLLGES